MNTNALTPDLRARLARHEAARAEREALADERKADALTRDRLGALTRDRLGVLAMRAVAAEAAWSAAEDVVRSLSFTPDLGPVRDRAALEHARTVASDARSLRKAAHAALNQAIAASAASAAEAHRA